MFVAYDISLQLIRALRPVVTTLREHDRDLASQLRRAASSIGLALAEGRDRRDGDRCRRRSRTSGAGRRRSGRAPRRCSA
jgi:four helix bundle protein